ncbi:hypothetical protein JOM56_013284 [Amanita muscaria]
MWVWVIIIRNIPLVAAASKGQQPFPNIPFSVFSKFVEDNFASTVSLSTVLMLLFTITENTDLFSLHFFQRSGERGSKKSPPATGWIRNLGTAVKRRLDENQAELLSEDDVDAHSSEQKSSIAIGIKMDALAVVLGLHPFNKAGKFTGKLKAVSHKQIQAVYSLCPNTATCQTMDCNKKALYQNTKPADLGLVTFIKDFTVYDDVPVYSGLCKQCGTIYYADHERSSGGQQHERVYLNSAKYIKIGQNMWVDRGFTNAVLSGMYTFHASASAYTEFWNNSFDLDGRGGVSRRQVWQAFVQESIRLVASASDAHLAIKDGLSIDEVTKEAYKELGANGILRSAEGHSCTECTHAYKRPADVIQPGNVADMVGMEERNPVEGQAEAKQPVDENEEAAPVKMVVIDGIVMGHTVSFHFFTVHLKDVEQSWPMLVVVFIVLCMSWNMGVHVMLPNHFIPPRMYCVETICAPCGVIVAWAKFDKAESPTNILEFLQLVYPEKDERPAYICIDKACVVLRTVVNDEKWLPWLETSRFIVDAYHYTNHKVSDTLCKEWCNPAPLNGSAPNLVIAERDGQGQLYYKRAFNTQACEQLNAWLGGFESILKRMTPGNFDWFLHTMLFYHTIQVLKKQKQRGGGEGEGEGEGDEFI